MSAILMPLKVLINFLWGATATALIGVLIFILGVIKFLLPLTVVHKWLSSVANSLFRLWGYAMSAMFSLTQPVSWHIEGDSQLHRDRWYMIICNHRSWVDILVLMHLACRNMPMPRFFLKQQLFWVPIIGVGCWALDMPFMKRYSREQIARNPRLQGRDIATTQKSCEKFRHIPTTVINFCEGTRFTPAKHAAKQSPFQNLLPPKAGGTAFTLQTMGPQFDAILDITITYPGSDRRPVVWDFLRGNLRNIYVHVETLPVAPELIGDYFSDDSFKNQFQQWLNQRWIKKDQVIEDLKQQISNDNATR